MHTLPRASMAGMLRYQLSVKLVPAISDPNTELLSSSRTWTDVGSDPWRMYSLMVVPARSADRFTCRYAWLAVTVVLSINH